ncbi:MAG: hypothetical protein QS721_05415 [Candidatus Endonucleobacter sp. (ex Gigantidas childressi)]|nr:hypothetical protein [Candidatus Endonucleobacter sp. (ex Gigantidas childressi)]
MQRCEYKSVTWHSKKKVSEVPLYIAVHRTLKGFLIAVATENSNNMINDYGKCWSIESLFDEPTMQTPLLL